MPLSYHVGILNHLTDRYYVYEQMAPRHASRQKCYGTMLAGDGRMVHYLNTHSGLEKSLPHLLCDVRQVSLPLSVLVPVL